MLIQSLMARGKPDCDLSASSRWEGTGTMASCHAKVAVGQFQSKLSLDGHYGNIFKRSINFFDGLKRHRTCRGQRLRPLNRLSNFYYN